MKRKRKGKRSRLKEKEIEARRARRRRERSRERGGMEKAQNLSSRQRHRVFRDEPWRSHPCLSGEEGVCAVIEAYGSCLSRANVVAAVTMLSNHGEELFPFFFETPDCHFQRKPSTRSFHLLRVHRHVARRRVTPPRARRSKEEERRTEKIRKGSTDGVFYNICNFFRRITRRGYLCCSPQRRRAEGPPLCTA